MSYDLGQTFFLDKAAVQNAEVCFIASINLYFRAKPVVGKTTTGIESPGVTLALCSVKEDGTPDLSSIPLDTARKEYDDISVSTTGATATTFTFSKPLCVSTDKKYCFLIKFDGGDTDFQVFANKAGKTSVSSTSITQVSSGTVDGNAYKITNGYVLTPLTDTDLNFQIRVAKFSFLTKTIKIKNRPYELLTVGSVSGTFLGGEEVFQQRSTLTGNVNVSAISTNLVGTSTLFTTDVVVGDKIVITDGGSNVNIRTVNSVTNATHLILTQPPSFTVANAQYYKTVTGRLFEYSTINDRFIIQDSTSTSTLYLTTGTTIRGLDSGATANITAIANTRVNNIIPNYNATTPPQTSISLTANFANVSGSVSTSRKIETKLGKREYLNTYDASLASRTNEVRAATPFKSFHGEMTLNTSNPYTSPFIRKEDLDVFVERYNINNSTTNESVNRGAAQARYVGNQVQLVDNQFAEDLKVYLKAFKPANSDVKVYAKFYNSADNEAFDKKNWTELSLNSASVGVTSNPSNINDFRDLGYDIPFFPPGTKITGNFAVNANGLIRGSSGTVNTDITVDDVVRVYHSGNSMVYIVDTVTAANTSSLTLSKAISNTTITDLESGFYVDKVTDKNTAYLDKQNFNMLTYFNGQLAKFQSYNSFAVKIVLLSSDNTSIPFVDDLQAVAVSA